MRVLHLTYKIKKGELLSDYLTILITKEKAQSVEVEVATTEKEFTKMLSSFKPDIVHIHSCWKLNTFVCAKKAKRFGCALLFSPHGELSPLAMKLEEPMRKKVRSITYQRKVVQMADAVLATSEKEKNEILQLGWNKRIDSVPSCLLNHSISTEEMAVNIIKIYTKVIDTRYRRNMDNLEWLCLCALLHTGLQQDPTNKIIPSKGLLELRGLTPQQWQRILICADDEFVRDYVDIGIERLLLVIPNINTPDISRYKPYMQKIEGELEKTKIEVGNFLLKSRYENAKEGEEDTIKQIVTMLAHAKVLLKQRKFSLLHLSQIYQVIRFEDYNEERLLITLRRMRLLKFARRMVYILSEYLYLEDGYAPFVPLNDKKIRPIIEKIINKNKY